MVKETMPLDSTTLDPLWVTVTLAPVPVPPPATLAKEFDHDRRDKNNTEAITHLSFEFPFFIAGSLSLNIFTAKRFQSQTPSTPRQRFKPKSRRPVTQ